MSAPNDLGRAGELAAQRYLMARGIRILETNRRQGGYEADIIASDGRHLLIVEVKSRTEFSLSKPAEAVDLTKARRMMLAGRQYAARERIMLPIRYDVIEAVYCPGSDVFEIKYHPGYFDDLEVQLRQTLPGRTNRR